MVIVASMFRSACRSRIVDADFRKVGETLMFGEEVTVTVMDVKGNQVRIGISAPQDVEVE
jgi:hypothetical protein